eukprot:scaffold144954_cov33-Tisochrysis_lutea.AAC.1
MFNVVVLTYDQSTTQVRLQARLDRWRSRRLATIGKDIAITDTGSRKPNYDDSMVQGRRRMPPTSAVNFSSIMTNLKG